MTHPHHSPSADGIPDGVTHTVSLEQLLSLSPQSVSRPDAPTSAEQKSIPTITSTPVIDEVSDESLPLILVAYEPALSPICVETKLRCVGSDVQIAWQPLQSALVEQAQLMHPYAVVLHFVSGASEVAAELAKQLQQAQPHLPVVALGSAQDPQVMLAALRAGVQDFVDIEASETDLRQSIKLLLAKSTQIEAPNNAASAPLVALLSSRAGMGSSLLAAHLSTYLQSAIRPQPRREKAEEKAQESVPLGALLLDLGAPESDGALYLDLVSEFDFIEAVQSLRRFDRKLASAGLTQHGSGLRLLSLPRQSSRLREIAYAEADMLVQRLREYFQFIVADLGGVSKANLAMRVAAKAAKVWLICDQSLASVVSTTELLRQLEEQQVSRSVMELIVCRYDRNLELSAQQIADQLQIPLLMTVPERRVELLQAVNQGQLLAQQMRREPYVQAVHKLVEILLRSQGVQSAAPKSALGQFFKSMRRA